jgi:hypothetical protein
MIPRLVFFIQKWHRRLGEMCADIKRMTHKAVEVKKEVVDGYPTFSSIPKQHRNKRFLTHWLSLDPQRFDQIPERLITTEMRYLFCAADMSRLTGFETLPFEEFEALVIMLFENVWGTASINPALLKESSLLKMSNHCAFHFVTVQSAFQEHLFTQRVISRLVRSSVSWAYHLYAGRTFHDEHCRERIRAMINDDDLLYRFESAKVTLGSSSGGKDLFRPDDIEYLKAMGRLHLLDHLVGLKQWSFNLEIPDSIGQCFWFMRRRESNVNCAAIYQAWLRQFPIVDVLAMADRNASCRPLAIPIFDTSLLMPHFKQYPWLKGHVLEDLLGL